jgi:uncharacterized protein YcbX
MQVTDLYIYPIKSCRGIALDQATVRAKGLLWDREYMLVDTRGNFLSQRQYPQLATVGVAIQDHSLILTQENKSFILHPQDKGYRSAVLIWRDRTWGIDQGDTVASWFSEILRQPCRLVRQAPEVIRPVDPRYAPNTSTPVSFADGYPLLLTGEGSLAQLNRRLAEKGNSAVPMDRFRPNVVVDTTTPFIEDEWQKIEVGEVKFWVVKPCSRCLVPTTDQNTGERNPEQEPLKTLQSFRRSPLGVLFGQNLIPESLGIIRRGDTVTPLQWR